MPITRSGRHSRPRRVDPATWLTEPFGRVHRPSWLSPAEPFRRVHHPSWLSHRGARAAAPQPPTRPLPSITPALVAVAEEAALWEVEIATSAAMVAADGPTASPASVIALAEDMRAKGHYPKTAAQMQAFVDAVGGVDAVVAAAVAKQRARGDEAAATETEAQYAEIKATEEKERAMRNKVVPCVGNASIVECTCAPWCMLSTEQRDAALLAADACGSLANVLLARCLAVHEAWSVLQLEVFDP